MRYEPWLLLQTETADDPTLDGLLTIFVLFMLIGVWLALLGTETAGRCHMNDASL